MAEITRARLATSATATLGYDLQHNHPVQAVILKSDIKVVAVYNDWFGFQSGYLPPNWVRVGRWEVPERTTLGELVVFFYGVGEENAERLRRNLTDFHNRLPQELVQLSIP
jgi:hypothetical protein